MSLTRFRGHYMSDAVLRVGPLTFVARRMFGHDVVAIWLNEHLLFVRSI